MFASAAIERHQHQAEHPGDAEDDVAEDEQNVDASDSSAHFSRVSQSHHNTLQWGEKEEKWFTAKNIFFFYALMLEKSVNRKKNWKQQILAAWHNKLSFTWIQVSKSNSEQSGEFHVDGFQVRPALDVLEENRAHQNQHEKSKHKDDQEASDVLQEAVHWFLLQGLEDFRVHENYQTPVSASERPDCEEEQWDAKGAVEQEEHSTSCCLWVFMPITCKDNKLREKITKSSRIGKNTKGILWKHDPQKRGCRKLQYRYLPFDPILVLQSEFPDNSKSNGNHS